MIVVGGTRPSVVRKARRNVPNTYIGRGSPWGNPYRIGLDGDRETVIRKYHTYLRRTPELLAEIYRLRGHDLVCFCAPMPCHGDVLFYLANADDPADAIFEFLLAA